MKSVILSSESGDDLNLLVKLAQKLGFKSKQISPELLEELGMAEAIKEGQTGENIDTEEYIKSLQE